MGGYFVIGTLSFIIYLITRDISNKKYFIRYAKQVSGALIKNDINQNFDSFKEEKLSLYLISNDFKAFYPINNTKPTLLISDLQYNNLVRFKDLLGNSPKSKGEFFRHKSHRHFIFPFINSTGSIELLLLEKQYETIDELIRRTPK